MLVGGVSIMCLGCAHIHVYMPALSILQSDFVYTCVFLLSLSLSLSLSMQIQMSFIGMTTHQRSIAKVIVYIRPQ